MRSPFMQSLEAFMIVRRYSKRTIRGYLLWVRAYIHFHDKQHPELLGDAHIEAFLTHLAVNRKVSISTQKTALNALAFLYNKFLEQPLGDVSKFVRVKRQPKLPTVLTEGEVMRLLQHIDAPYKLPIGLLYGSGLRQMELVRLRVKDIDCDLKQIQVWNGKGFKHRLTTLAPELMPAIERQIQKVEHYLAEDVNNADYAGVYLPDALGKEIPACE